MKEITFPVSTNAVYRGVIYIVRGNTKKEVLMSVERAVQQLMAWHSEEREKVEKHIEFCFGDLDLSYQQIIERLS